MEVAVFQLTSQLFPFWPLLAVTLILSMVGRVLAEYVFTDDACQGEHSSHLRCLGYRTLSLQPIVVGAAIGLVWRNPVPSVDTLIESVGCFALCGAVSVWAYQVGQDWARKHGILIRLPGVDDSEPPPPPPRADG